MVPGAIVVGTGSHDSYQFPLALHEGGLLHRFVTDMYWPADRRWFRATAGALLPERWIEARFRVGLDSRAVRICAEALGTSTLMKALPWLQLNRRKDVALSLAAARLALKTGAPLFAYSYYAGEAFKKVQNAIPQRFLHQIHPHPVPVRAILREEIERVPQARFSLLREPDLILSGEDFAILADEPHLANGWLVASRYTASTLVAQGIPAENIHVVPYGVDTSTYQARSDPPRKNAPFTVMFIGSIGQRKGLWYLLEALRHLNTRSIRLLLRGRGVIDQELLSAFPDVSFDLKVNRPTSEIVAELHEADLFVLPSVTEGFGHVILQAMACGVPVLTTTNTCGPDVIEEGRQGFIVPIRDPAAIAERLAWGLDHRETLAELGREAALRARMLTWEHFREGVREAYHSMIESIAHGTRAGVPMG